MQATWQTTPGVTTRVTPLATNPSRAAHPPQRYGLRIDSRPTQSRLLLRKRPIQGVQLGTKMSDSLLGKLQSNERPSRKLQSSAADGVETLATGLLHLVPHLDDYLGPLERSSCPLLNNRYTTVNDLFFVKDYDVVCQTVAWDTRDVGGQTFFRRAGPRESVVFNGEDVKAAIVTCGGLCPGINTVIREVVNALWNLYDVRCIKGIRAGYRGFYSSEPLDLNPAIVDDWHKRGGSALGTSRGGFDLERIVDSIETSGFNQVYVIGGDGSMRGAIALFQEIQRRKLKVSIVGIPKTVDNDIGIIDKSFGLDTAVDMAQEAIAAAHVEAESTPNGIGVVKLMGRNAGHIAARATLSSRDVDCCLIPEVPFYLEGDGGLFEFLDSCLSSRGHCVLVVAEGAGQELIPRTEEQKTTDASGNLQLLDIGSFLVTEIKQWWKKTHPDKLSSVKYIDPTYMVRAVPSNAADTLYCTLLAHSAVHGSMAGYTGYIAGPVNGVYAYIAMAEIATITNRVNMNDHALGWVRATNNQPDFLKSTKEPSNLPSSNGASNMDMDFNKSPSEDLSKVAAS